MNALRIIPMLLTAALLLLPLMTSRAQENGNRQTIKGSGVVKTESRPVSDFSSISLSGIGKVSIRQTGREALTIHAEDNILPVLETHVSNRNLALGIAKHTSIQPTKPIEFIIEVKNLEGLTVSGVGNMDAKDIQSRRLAVNISGAGNVSAAGSGDELEVKVSGTGSYKGEDFKTRRATVRSSGVGHVVVNASQTLDANVSGVGSVEYLGAPQVQKTVSGIGRIKRR